MMYAAFPMPAKIGKDGPEWDASDVDRFLAMELLTESCNQLQRRAAMITTDYEKATEIVDGAEAMFRKSHSQLSTTVHAIQADVKKASGNIRKAADDLASGLAKVEKTANFSNLERYVGLLERAAAAMSTLAELEKSGKLDKIAGALK